MADPTMEFLRSFTDPRKWVVKRNVPIFKSHTRRTKGPNGEDVEIVVGPAELDQIARNMQALESQHGVVGRITPGHIQPHLPETAQPELYGFMRNARVGTFGPGNEPCVLVDEYLFPDRVRDRESYPYRSPEYFPGQKTIRGLAVLKRDPFLDLGVVYTAADRCYPYATAEVPTVDNDTTKPADDATPSPDEQAQMDALMSKYMKYACQKYNLQPVPQQPATPAPAQTEPVRMQLDQMRVSYEQQLTQYKTQHDRLTADLASLRYERDQERCERLVVQLEAEGYQLGDRSKMVGRLAKMSDADRTAELDHIRLCYSRVPVPRGSTPEVTPLTGTEGGTAQKQEQEKHEKALDYMRANPGVQYEAAYAKVNA